MNCVNCGGALPPKSSVCAYCRTRNDVDLRMLFDIGRHWPDEIRHCPNCDESLETIDLGLGRPFFLDRCRRCLGLLFDPGELREVVRLRAEEAERIDYLRLERLLAEETPEDFSDVRYMKCPTCRKLMHRRLYGTRAGVIVDECRDHGVWLEAGELRRILAWTRAGGAAHDAVRAEEQARQDERNRRTGDLLRPEIFRGGPDTSDPNDPDLGGLVGCLMRMILR